MADFIKRLATAEQFLNHNNKLMDDMNELIASQERKSKELAVHQQNIIVKRKDYVKNNLNLVIELLNYNTVYHHFRKK